MEFFRDLARHNNRDWFVPRKHLFEQHVKQPMYALVDAVNAALAEFAPEYVTPPEKAVYRFYRDTRFSKDKTPYKDHIAASFPRKGMPRHAGAGYYFSVSHKEIGIGGGVYMPLPESLLAIRNHLAGNHEEFRGILKSRSLKRLFGEMQGEALARVPKGFSKDHPAEDLLRRKQFLVYVELPPEPATTGKLYGTIREHFRAMAPFVKYLNKPLAAPKKKNFFDGFGPGRRLK
jgi:uncharacterized protein (TIGR02453 family)